MKKLVLIAMVLLILITGYFLYSAKFRDSEITSEYCYKKGGKVVNTLNYLVDGEELADVSGSYVQIVDPKIMEKSIGKVEDMDCPCVCVVE